VKHTVISSQFTSLNVHINPLKPKLVKIVFKDSVRTAKKTPHLTVTKINWLTLFKEVIAVYGANSTKPINTNAVLLIAEPSGR
jgi:hypothetical protein